MLQVGRSRRLEGPGEKHLGGYRNKGVQRAAASKDCHHSRDDRDGSQPVRMSGAFDIKTRYTGPWGADCHCQAGVREAGCACAGAWGFLAAVHMCNGVACWMDNGPTDAERADWSSCRRLTTAQGWLSRSVPWSLRTVDCGQWTVKRVVCPAPSSARTLPPARLQPAVVKTALPPLLRQSAAGLLESSFQMLTVVARRRSHTAHHRGS